MGSIIKTYNSLSEKPGSTVVSTILGLAVPIAMIAMGVIHKDDCPAQKYIAIYLIVAGAVAVPMTILRLVARIFCTDSHGEAPLPFQIVNGVIGIFQLAWFIAGNVWVYSLYGKYEPTDTTADNYCMHDFYLFAFWLINTAYIFFGLCILLCCCIACC